LEWAWCDSGGFGGTSEAAGFFLGGLVEAEFDLDWTTGGLEPLLLTVNVWDDVVVFYHFELFVFESE
jgi:hypothetical protein